jgi:hypothetical protein
MPEDQVHEPLGIRIVSPLLAEDIAEATSPLEQLAATMSSAPDTTGDRARNVTAKAQIDFFIFVMPFVHQN